MCVLILDYIYICNITQSNSYAVLLKNYKSYCGSLKELTARQLFLIRYQKYQITLSF